METTHAPSPAGVSELLARVVDELRHGPLSTDVLAHRLSRSDAVPQWLNQTGTDVEQLVTKLVASTGAVCTFVHDGQQFCDLIPKVIHNRVFTYRITERDIAEGGIGVSTELALIKTGFDQKWLDKPPFAVGPGLTNGSSPAANEPGWRGLFGPPGWFDELQPGMVVAVHLRESVLQISEVQEPSGGEAEIDALIELMQPKLAAGIGFTLEAPMLELLLSDHPRFGNGSLFTKPTRPLSELLAERGYVQRNFAFGPANRPWEVDGAELRWHWRELRTPPDVEPCCVEALDVAHRAIEIMHFGSSTDKAPPTPPEISEALDHHNVAGLFVSTAYGPGDGPEVKHLANFCIDITSDNTEESGTCANRGPVLALAALSELEGRPLDAERVYARMIEGDSPSPMALERLAWIEFDRGNYDNAAELLSRSPNSSSGDIAKVMSVSVAVSGSVPDSGLDSLPKMASGATGHDGLTDQQRAIAVFAKLSNAARMDADMALDASMTVEMSGFQPAQSQSTFPLEVLMFEGGWAQTFLDRRRDLLPPAECELLSEWIRAPLRALEVTALSTRTNDDTYLFHLRDGVTGETATAAYPIQPGYDLTPIVEAGDDLGGPLSFVSRVLWWSDISTTTTTTPDHEPMLIGECLSVDRVGFEAARNLLPSAADPISLLWWYNRFGNDHS